MSGDDTTKTWFIDDTDLFPERFLGMPSPQRALFLAVEGQSTDDGKVFINPLDDQDNIAYMATILNSQQVDHVVGQIKTCLHTKKFKEQAIADESEHGVAVFASNDPDTSLLVVFGSQRSSLLLDQAITWLGETGQEYSAVVRGVGEELSQSFVARAWQQAVPPKKPAKP